MNFTKSYIIVSVLAVGSILIPVMSVFLSIFTFGLFGLVVPLWTYLTVLWPAIWLKRNGQNWYVYVPAAVVSVICLAALPPLYAEREAGTHRQLVESNSLSNQIPQDWKNLTIVEHVRQSSLKKNGIPNARCNALCQRLLVLDLVDNVTLKIINHSYQGDLEEEITSYRLKAHNRICPPLHAIHEGSYYTELEMTKREIAKGRCIIPKLQNDVPDGIVIEFGQEDFSFLPKLKLAYLSNKKNLTVSLKSGDQIERLVSKVSYKITTARLPFMVTTFGSLMYGQGGVKFSSKSKTINPYLLENFLLDALDLDFLPYKSNSPRSLRQKFSLADISSGQFVPNTNEIAYILTKPGKHDFSPTTQSLIGTWLQALANRTTNIDDLDVSTLSKLFSDDRFTWISQFQNLLHLRPDIIPKIETEIRNRISKQSCKKRNGCRQITDIFAKWELNNL